MMEANRKASTRNQADIEKIKALLKQFSSKLSNVAGGVQGSSPSGEKDVQLDFDETTQNDGANMVDSGQLDLLKTLLRNTERTLTLRLQDIEKVTSRFGKLQDRVDILEQPKGPVISDDDISRWNKANERSLKNEELLNGMRKELNALDGTKIKADIIQLFRITSSTVSKEDFDTLKE